MPDALAFVIMQIGDTDLDRVYAEAIAPAIDACGLAARRVDKHNQGGLLKSEIVRFIQDATIIVAELTNERPNVYLEVGYSMGLDKFRNLVLTVREDHFPDSPNHQRGGPRIHFDLAGYDVLRWAPSELLAFRSELERRIRRRLAVIATPKVLTTQPPVDAEWVDQQRESAVLGFEELGRFAHMEIVAAIDHPKPVKTLTELNDAAAKAPIHTFGWPIAAYLHPDGVRPKPRADGIAARILSMRDSFDYWALRRNGDFYYAGTLFEDQRKPGMLFFDTRTIRVTEALMYLLRLYGFLEVPREQSVTIRIRHVGLHGRAIAAANPNRRVWPNPKAEANDSEVEIHATLDHLEANLTTYVRSVVEPMFELFDLKRFDSSIIDQIANNFVQGRI